MPAGEWFRNAIVYSASVETFMDGNGDGTGDFVGMREQLDHLEGLGVDLIWLAPIQPTPDRDDGYDIVDYYGVDRRLGSAGDFVQFLEDAAGRGIRVILDLVVNHTSDRHPWFLEAQRAVDSPFRDWYVWADEPPAEPGTGVVFPDAEDSIWARDDKTGQWYLHHFYRHQPDLDIANPAVRD